MKQCIVRKELVLAIIVSIFIFSVFITNIGSMNININTIRSFENQSNFVKQFNILADPLADVWDVELEFNEPGGSYDNAKIGEKTNASDGKDGYDGRQVHHAGPKRKNPANVAKDRFRDPYQEHVDLVVRVGGEPGYHRSYDNEPHVEVQDEPEDLRDGRDEVAQDEHFFNTSPVFLKNCHNYIN